MSNLKLPGNVMLSRLVFVVIVSILVCLQNQVVLGQELSGRHVYWEDLTDNQKDQILSSKRVSGEALEFYRGHLKIADDTRTFALLDTLSSSTDRQLLPFYFFLFNVICIKADGALAEGFGVYCQRVVLNSPAFVIGYLGKNKTLLKTYAQLIGAELQFKDEGLSSIEYNYRDFRKILSEKLPNKEAYSATLMLFYGEIEKAMKMPQKRSALMTVKDLCGTPVEL